MIIVLWRWFDDIRIGGGNAVIYRFGCVSLLDCREVRRNREMMVPISVMGNPALEVELNDKKVKAVIISGNRVYLMLVDDSFIEVTPRPEDDITLLLNEHDRRVSDELA